MTDPFELATATNDVVQKHIGGVSNNDHGSTIRRD
jgi:hypothetical protein